MGLVYFIKQEFEKSIECFTLAIKSHPNPLTQLQKGDAHCYLKQFDEAKQCYLDILKGTVNENLKAIVLTKIGIAYSKLGEVADLQEKNRYYTEALTFFLKAQEYRPDKSKILNEIGIAYYHVGNLKEALIHFEKCIKIQGLNIPALLNFRETIAQLAKRKEFEVVYDIFSGSNAENILNITQSEVKSESTEKDISPMLDISMDKFPHLAKLTTIDPNSPILSTDSTSDTGMFPIISDDMYTGRVIIDSIV